MNKYYRFIKLIPILWLFLSAALFAQTDYAIGVGDLIAINVLGVDDFKLEIRVNPAGTIQMPFIGEVKLQGLTSTQAQAKLADLLDPDYVKSPQVSVIIKEARSRTFSVAGAVKKPDQYQIVQPITLTGAIAGAGGLDFEKAGDIAKIQRNPAQPGASDSIDVNIKKLIFESDMSLDIPIMPGDIINIPIKPSNPFYVIGDVTHPGSFGLPDGKQIMLSRALAMAGGPTKTSKLKDAVLLHQGADGSIDRTPLDVDKILKGKLSDVAMLPSDLLYVPGSVSKSLGWTVLQQIPNVLIWGVLR
jgi:polysaccharide biosynthesis/export protein